MKLRTYTPTQPSRVQYISEAEVFSRTLTAIRTLKAMPDRERRFLASGTKAAWPAWTPSKSRLHANIINRKEAAE